MTTAAALSRSASTGAPAVHTSRLSFAGAVRSEWIKALSLRSIRWSIALSVLLGAVMTYGMGLALRALTGEDPAAGQDFLKAITSFPAGFLSLVFGVLGVFVFSSEYASGMILSTLTAVPRRGLVMAAKAVVLTIIAATVAAVVLVAGAGIGVALIPESAAELWTTATLTSLLGTGFFLVSVALFAFAVAGLLRSTAGAITTVVAIVFVLPAMLQIVGSVSDWTWVQVVWNYLPTSLGSTLGMGFVQGGLPSADPAVHSPGYLEAMAALAAWVVLPTVAAAEAFLSRDAK